MSDLTLNRGQASESLGLIELLKEMFRATPLGIVLSTIARR